MAIKIGRNLFILPFVGLISLIIGLVLGLKLLYESLSEGRNVVFRVKPRNRPVALSDDKYGKHCYIDLPGRNIKLHYVINGEEGKPLIVFLHGFPQFWYTWRHQLTDFCTDYRTVAVDLRGFGESEKPLNPARYDVEEMADDIKQLIESLNYRSCVLVGHDLGGTVGWSLAARHPGHVSRLILCNSPHPASIWEIANIDPIYTSRIMWRRFLYLLPVLPILYMRSRDLYQFQQLLTGGETGARPDTYTEEDIEAYKYTYQSYDSWRGALNYYKAQMLCNLPLYKSQRINVETLMIWGAREQMIPRECCVLTKKRVDKYSITGTLGGTHWLHEEEPKVVNDYIREYLATGKVENIVKKGDIYEVTKGFAV